MKSRFRFLKPVLVGVLAVFASTAFGGNIECSLDGEVLGSHSALERASYGQQLEGQLELNCRYTPPRMIDGSGTSFLRCSFRSGRTFYAGRSGRFEVSDLGGQVSVTGSYHLNGPNGHSVKCNPTHY